MGLLRLAVLGPPEIFHDSNRLTFSLRKAQALLFYLAVEGAYIRAASWLPCCGPIVLPMRHVPPYAMS
ncbi:hypothetical protein KSF_027970 [Reticulibacter mediterranei]|uniref:Uncharacterized protein n=1 Tax=Reticulibacter mediterranei TaxID=2778369 RepID=A0A8J3IJT6_9CHLR|nr:hypothetical protein KSF_027970 [Reticulibacter mediterranei]